MHQISLMLLFTTILAHSWVEQVQRINGSGIYDGPLGFPRAFVSRADPNFQDANMTYRLPPPSRNRIDDSDRVCSPLQAGAYQSPGFPRLTIPAGDYMAMKYLENGHVTLPHTPPGKPDGSGTVAVYAASYGDEDVEVPALIGILSWNSSGLLTEGRLLSAQPFDDARCYQLNPSSDISTQRQAVFPNHIPGQTNAVHEQWCETSIQIPTDAPTGARLTLYWVWAWPTLDNVDANTYNGKDEYYTTCLDVVIGCDEDPVQAIQLLPYQDPQTVSVTGYRERASTLDTRFLRIEV